MPTGLRCWSIASSPIRRDKRLAARLRYARLRQQASIEDVDYPAPRGLDRALFQRLTNGEWIDAHDNLILCGPTEGGKSWLACPLGHKACRDNRSVLYQRVPKLFSELALARGDGRYARILRSLTGIQLLILDDWGLEPLDAGARRDLYEILEERYGRRSTILTSQIPVDNGTPSSASRRPHDASFFERVVRRTCVLNSTICVFERLICQGIPLVIWWPDNRPF
jgi:DNA replication protein DnaC